MQRHGAPWRHAGRPASGCSNRKDATDDRLKRRQAPSAARTGGAYGREGVLRVSIEPTTRQVERLGSKTTATAVGWEARAISQAFLAGL